MVAHDLRLPINLVYGHPEEDPAPLLTAHYAMKLQEEIEAAHHHAHHPEQRLTKGTPVWLYNPQRRRAQYSS